MPKGMKNMRTLLLMIFAALSLSVSAQTITLNGNVKDTWYVVYFILSN